MTRGEAEEIFIAVVMSGESAAIEMSLPETQVFRVLIGRTMKEMEKKNRTMWLKARDFGIEYKAPYAIVKKLDVNRYKMYKLGANGTLTPFERAPMMETIVDEATTNIVIDESKGDNNEQATNE